MKRIIMAVIISLFFLTSLGFALKRPGVEFKIFQFPGNMIPRIDGKTDDWDMVPKSYVIGADELMDTVKGHGLNRDPKNFDCSVKVGWVKGENRLYFLYEADDNYWNMYYARGDIFELVVDGDLSGGSFIENPQLNRKDNYYNFHGMYAQNYHIFTPPGEGRDWAMVWGCQPWIRELPFANYAYNYNFKEGESGHLILEFFITPFDYAPYDGPDRAIISKLVENTIIGMSWAVLDYDENTKEYEGFWNLSHETMMYGDASCLVAFRLMPLEPQFRKPIEAEWSFKTLDRDKRIVAFKDLSFGQITSWLWDFGDGTTSTEQNPIHTYQEPKDYNVILNIEGPAGKAKRIKIFDVVVY